MRTYRLALAAALLGFAAPGLAATTTATFQVSATVQPSCRLLNVNPLAFGIYDAAANKDVTTTFQVQCTRLTTWQIGLDNGQDFAAAPAPFDTYRAMQGNVVNTEFLAYGLFTDAPGGTAWGNTPGTDPLDSSSPTGAPVTVTIYGRIPLGQYDASAQGYTDSAVTITVNY